MIIFLASLTAFADNHCEEWGQIDVESSQTLNLGQEMELAILDEDCGDVDTCVWDLEYSGDFGGELSASSGSESTYTAPSLLTDCLSTTVTIAVTCNDVTDEDTVTDEIQINIECSEDDIDAMNGLKSWTPKGGGCSSPQYAFFLLMPILFRGRKS